jgi:hypothetical protein
MPPEEIDINNLGWVEVHPSNHHEINHLFGIDSLTDAYNKVDSVKRLGEIGIHVTFYNRDKIIHNYGK